MLPSTYKRSMCTVLESVFCRMTKDILLLDDMAAEETIQVNFINLIWIFFFVWRKLDLKLTHISYALTASKTDSFDAGKPIFFTELPQ